MPRYVNPLAKVLVLLLCGYHVKADRPSFTSQIAEKLAVSISGQPVTLDHSLELDPDLQEGTLHQPPLSEPKGWGAARIWSSFVDVKTTALHTQEIARGLNQIMQPSVKPSEAIQPSLKPSETPAHTAAVEDQREEDDILPQAVAKAVVNVTNSSTEEAEAKAVMEESDKVENQLPASCDPESFLKAHMEYSECSKEGFKHSGVGMNDALCACSDAYIMPRGCEEASPDLNTARKDLEVTCVAWRATKIKFMIYFFVHLCIWFTASFLVIKWNRGFRAERRNPGCGIKSIICCCCCTICALCFPIDADPPPPKEPSNLNAQLQ